MRHEEWLTRTIGSDSQRSTAGKVGVPQSTISRQLAKGKLDPELVIAIARAYEVSAIDALVDTDYLKEDDVDIAGVPQALGYATNQQLYEEIMRRVDPDAARLFRPRSVITPDFTPRTPAVRPGSWAVSDIPASVAAHNDDEKGVPDIPSEAEESQDRGQEDFDPA